MEIRKAAWQEEEETRKDFSIVLTRQCCYSGRFLQVHLSCRMCNQFYIPSSIQDWYLEAKFWATDRQYSFCLWILWNRLGCTATCTIHAQSMEETSKHSVLGRHEPCSEEKIEVLSDTIERYHSPWNTHRLLYPKVVRMETGDVMYEKAYASLRPPPTISLKHDWMKELGSEVAQRPEGQVVQQSKSSQSNQPHPNPDHDRTGRPVGCSQGAPRSSNQEIETRSSRDCKNSNLDVNANHDRTGRRVVCSERAPHSSDQNMSQTRSSRDSKNFNLEEDGNHDRSGRPVVCSQQEGPPSMSDVVDIDFRISGLPHSVVKQAESSRVRELVKQIFFFLQVNSLRKSRSPFTDKIFNSIYDKTKPTTHLV